MIVIVPTRERPLNAADLIEAWKMTGATARLFFAVDETDPQMPAYEKLLKDAPGFVSWRRCPTTTMIEALNYAAVNYRGTHDVVGFMGDDHRPRTHRWDQHIREIFDRLGPRVVYGNDTIQGPMLPTAVFLPGEFVARANKMCPGGLVHMYADNYWKALGERADLITYLPDLVIQHVHPITGQVPWDEGYIRVNDGGLMATDKVTFDEYTGSVNMSRDVAILEELHAKWSA